MSEHLPVLYAEDDENDAFLMERAFRKTGILNPLQIVRDGHAAIDYLSGHGAYADRQRHPLPCLALLDLNLPRISGLEVVKWMRDQAALQKLPAVILTSSNQDRDIRSAYQLGANAYLVKPPSAEKLIDLVGSLRQLCLLHSPAEGNWMQLKGNLPPPKSKPEPAV